MKYFIFILTSLILTAVICSSQTFSSVNSMKNSHIVIRKKSRLLQIYDGENLIKTYKIALGFSPDEDKEVEGDGKTPEGEFYVFTKNQNSKFYLSLGISYPNAEDAKRGLENEIITREESETIIEASKQKQMPPQKTKLGGEIYIHGGGNSSDWTNGCVALDDQEMKEIFDTVLVGTSVKILP